MLCTFERKILRVIYCRIQDKGRNSEIYNLWKDLNTVGDIELERLG